MIIVRQGKNFVVQQNGTNIQENLTFDEARQFLAKNGNEDAQKPLVKHSLTVRGERIQDPAFRGEYELCLTGRY